MQSLEPNQAITRLLASLRAVSPGELKALCVFCSGVAGMKDALRRRRLWESKEYWLLANATQALLASDVDPEPALARARTVIEAALQAAGHEAAQ